MASRRIRNSYTITDFYEHYKSNIDLNTVYDVESTVYRSVVEEYLKYFATQVIENSKDMKFPYRLGRLSIVKRQPKNFDSRSLRIDYHESKVQGKVVYLLNEHSNYYKYRYYWSKRDCMIPNKGKYQFVATRANKRRLAQIIKNKEHDYITLR